MKVMPGIIRRLHQIASGGRSGREGDGSMAAVPGAVYSNAPFDGSVEWGADTCRPHDEEVR